MLFTKTSTTGPKEIQSLFMPRAQATEILKLTLNSFQRNLQHDRVVITSLLTHSAAPRPAF
jgi:hypothetical protein